MASSAVYGAHVGLQETGQWAVAILCGVVTAIAGGIVRDVLCLEPPRALYAERSMYTTPALLGAGFYVLLYLTSGADSTDLPQWLIATAPFLLAVMTRAAAWTFRLALPHWARKTSYFGPFQFSDKMVVDFTPDIGDPVEKN